MLASPTSEWPQGGGWVLEPKYDGYRLLVETRTGGRVCAWSRHGTSMTEPLRELLTPFSALGAGWVFDGELIALADRDGGPVQDFAAVGRAVFGGDAEVRSQLHYVAFDVLLAGTGGDVRCQPWRERSKWLTDRFPAGRRLRPVPTLEPAPETHAQLVRRGFEGSMLKRENSSYRPGRTRSWRKLKARHELIARVIGVHQDRERRIWARCALDDGRRCTVWANERAEQLIGQSVTVVFSRIDADGGLREARLHQSHTCSVLPIATLDAAS
jgi:ATP-dependent DNA ligase